MYVGRRSGTDLSFPEAIARVFRPESCWFVEQLRKKLSCGEQGSGFNQTTPVSKRKTYLEVLQDRLGDC